MVNGVLGQDGESLSRRPLHALQWKLAVCNGCDSTGVYERIYVYDSCSKIDQGLLFISWEGGYRN